MKHYFLFIILVLVLGCSTANEIKWLDFEEGLKRAKKENKLILLDISAKWCHYCNLMETTTYSDKEVIKIINEKFIPVKVDADLRKDINKKYNQGGLPTTAILTQDGTLIYGNLYLPPEDLKKVLLYFSSLSKEEIEKIKNEKDLKSQLPFSLKEIQIDKSVFDLVNTNILGMIDKEYGGYDDEVKFPIDNIVYYLILKYLENPNNLSLLKKTLQGYEKLIDKEEGGIFRYATKRDWTQPHYEKLLRDQASIALAFFNAYSVLKDKSLLDDANLILDFSKKTLYNQKEKYFYGSQGADIVDDEGKILVSGEVYFSKNKQDRIFLENVYRRKLPLDDNFYFGENALMVKTLAYSYLFNKNNNDLKIAEDLMTKIIKEGFKQNGIIHTPKVNKYFLDNQINTLDALFTLYQITGKDLYLKNFKNLLDVVLKIYYSQKIGLFTDYEDTGLNLNRISYVDNIVSLNFKLAKIIYQYQLLDDNKKLENIKNSILNKLTNFNTVETALGLYLYFKPPIFSIYVNKEKVFNNKVYEFFPFWNIGLSFTPEDNNFRKLGYPYEGFPIVYICSLRMCFEKIKYSDIENYDFKIFFKKYLNQDTM